MADDVQILDKRDMKPTSRLARRFADLVQGGKSPKAAGELLGIDLGDSANYGLAYELAEVIRGYAAKPEIDRELVRAARRKILVEGLGMGGGEKDHKLALEAAKQIASDPDVGLNAPPAPLVSLNLGTLEEILEHIDEKDVIVDVPANLEPAE